MQEQNYRIVLPPACGPMVSMCHLKCVGPYGVHVSPKCVGPYSPSITHVRTSTPSTPAHQTFVTQVRRHGLQREVCF